jgi:UDP-N-acetylglucosamine:LPS N-acetylglucosamine transferase
VLGVASGGGHWIQLTRILPAFDGEDVAFVSTLPSCAAHVPGSRFYAVTEANLTSKLRLLLMAFELLLILVRERPHVVISTGAAPGYIALRLAKLIGARTIWIDSIANANTLSTSGERVGRYADLWLTQWPHLARHEGPHFVGAVL